MSAPIISCRRLTRSATPPATNPTVTDGSAAKTAVSPNAAVEPVRSSTSSCSANTVAADPSKEMNRATRSVRMPGKRNSSNVAITRVILGAYF